MGVPWPITRIQLTSLRHWTVAAFLSRKKRFTKNRSVSKMPWHRLSIRVACSYSSGPGKLYPAKIWNICIYTYYIIQNYKIGPRIRALPSRYSYVPCWSFWQMSKHYDTSEEEQRSNWRIKPRLHHVTNTDFPEIFERVILASHVSAFYKKVRIHVFWEQLSMESKSRTRKRQIAVLNMVSLTPNIPYR